MNKENETTPFKVTITQSKIIESENFTDALLEAEIWMLDEKGVGYGVELIQ